jgi:hypothetical protein
MKVRLVYCLPIVLQQLPSCSSYCHATTTILHISSTDLEEDPQPPSNL